MDNQNGPLDLPAEHVPDPADILGAEVPARETGAVVPTFFNSPADEEQPLIAMNADPAPTPSLTGSLAAFGLSEVLSMLATTSHSGQLEVVGPSVDGRLWLDRGDLTDASVGSTSTIDQAVFELACLNEGWFAFTSGDVSFGPHAPVSVDSVLGNIGPQVEEWRTIRELVPLEANVALAPDPPGHDVQIRSDQWRVLATIGSGGHTVESVIDSIGGDRVTGLRALRDLRQSGLIELDSRVDTAPTGLVPPVGQSPISPTPLIVSEDSVEELVAVPPPETEPAVVGNDDRFESLAEVAIMPPPIAGDPLAPVAEPSGTDTDGVA
jgi:Domain of unknown function (DUF4388)